MKVDEWLDANYTEMQICEMRDNNVMDYLDDDWEDDGYDCEFTWYGDHCNGEAEDDVVLDLTREYCRANGIGRQDFVEQGRVESEVKGYLIDNAILVW